MLLGGWYVTAILFLIFLWIISPTVRKKIIFPNLPHWFLTPLAILLILGNIIIWIPFFGAYAYLIKPFLLLGATWLFLCNFRITGFLFAGIGNLLNTIVMFGNGFRMPIVAGLVDFSKTALYVPIAENTFLSFLADCFSVPIGEGIFFFSIGDILIFIGLLIAIIQLTSVCVSDKMTTEKKPDLS